MQGINEYIVQVEKPLNDKMTLGDTEIYVDPSFDQTKHSNRIGKVISTPLGLETPIQAGDEVLLVHTILMYQEFQYGRTDSVYLVDKDKGYYRVPMDLIIMFRRDAATDWKCYGINLMIEPIKAEAEDYKIGGLYLPDNYYGTNIECNTGGYHKQYGYVKYINEDLEALGVAVGDKVFFVDFGDYEFNIDGNVLYCMDNRDVLAIIE